MLPDEENRINTGDLRGHMRASQVPQSLLYDSRELAFHLAGFSAVGTCADRGGGKLPAALAGSKRGHDGAHCPHFQAGFFVAAQRTLGYGFSPVFRHALVDSLSFPVTAGM